MKDNIYYKFKKIFCFKKYAELRRKQRKILLSFAFFISFGINLFAAQENYTIGGRSAGMGYTSVTFSDFWSIQNNQAGLTSIKHTNAGFYYENKFFLKELSFNSCALVLPTKSGVFGFSTNYFGYNKYNESKFGLAYAKQLGKKISVGIQIDYLYTHIAENYGNKGIATFEIGFLSNLTNEFSIGAHIFNPISAKLNDYGNERIPTVFKLGLSYNFNKKVLVCTEVEKDFNFKPLFKAGLEYHIVKEIYIRAGISTNPTLFTFGFGLEFKNLKLDLASSMHPVLGYSPQISLIYGL